MKQRKPLRKVSKKRAAVNRQRRKAMIAAFGENPVCAVPWCSRPADDAHERRSRARRGSIVDPENVAPLCRSCHTIITDTEPAWAYELQLLRHSWETSEGAA